MLNTVQRAYVELSVIEGELSILVDRIRKVMYRLRHGGNEPSPAKPRPRREFNDDMQELLRRPRMAQGVRAPKGFDRSVVQRSPFSLDDLLSDLIEEINNEQYRRLTANSSPASDAAGPRRARPATPARRVTSSNATKPGRRGKGGK